MIVNKVKELVDLLASKDEATGFISDLDFNMFGSMAQSQKLEYDLDRKNNSGTFIASSLSAFKPTVMRSVVDGVMQKPDDYRHYETASYPNTVSKKGRIVYVPFLEKTNDEWNFAIASELEEPSLDHPSINVNGDHVLVLPRTIQQVKLTYVINPPDIVWGYKILNSRKVYDEAGAGSGGADSVDFTFGEDDMHNLVYRILVLAGVSFREGDLTNLMLNKEIE